MAVFIESTGHRLFLFSESSPRAPLLSLIWKTAGTRGRMHLPPYVPVIHYSASEHFHKDAEVMQ